MNFPVWDVGFGLPLLIALVAIPHVFVSHFAVGGGLFLVIYEGRARRLGDTAMLDYVRRHSRFFMLLTLVFGALTGVGIWFTIGLISPAATSALIHAFVWFWATEWVMFFVEIAASLVYYYGWDKLDAKTHQAVMWVYFGAAWGSLVVINGIITFMLSSGSWPQDRNIWGAFFNVTYWPSLVTRTLLAFLMAGLFAFLTAAWLKDEELKRRVNKIAALWTLPTLVLLAGSALWYFKALPMPVKHSVSGDWSIIHQARFEVWLMAGFIFVSVFGAQFIRPRSLAKYEAILLLAFGLVMFGSFEWYREAARKPFVISNYMYSNGLLTTDTTSYKLTGYTSHLKWIHAEPARKGEDLYRAVCASCHSLTGYNGLAEKIAQRGWTPEQVANLVPRVGYLRAPMPPWVGKPEEAQALAGYLSSEAAKLPKPAPTVIGKDAQVWAANCGLCHTINGYRPLHDAFAGMKMADLKEAIKSSGDLSDAMPPFTGSDREAEQIASYALHELDKAPKGGK